MELYIEGNRVELFKDENVSLNSSVANLKDISKVFTDFSQGFTVPASPQNNLILKHWYNADINNGFDARVAKDATIELKKQPFKLGKIRLESAKKIKGKISSYKLTFIGNLIKLPELFGDDLLTDLDLSAHTHPYDSDEVLLAVQNEGDYIYPLISSDRIWTLGTDLSTSISFDDLGGVDWNELKPAIKWSVLMDAIKVKYGLQFTGGFFDSPQFTDVYMWASREKGLMRAYGTPLKQTYTGTGVNIGNVISTFDSPLTIKSIFNWSITPEAGYEDVPYTVIKRINGVDVATQHTGFYSSGLSSAITDDTTVEIWIKAGAAFSWTSQGDLDDLPSSSPDPLRSFTGNTGVVDATGIVYFADEIVSGVVNAGQLPKLKIIDFLKGLIKAFNLVILPNSSTSFEIKKLKDWYTAGEIKDISKYIDLATEEVIKPSIHKSIAFKYKEPKTILQAAYNDTNGDYYGDLEVETIYEGTDFIIELPFENMLLSRITSDAGVLSDILVGNAIDSELNSVKTAPINFYRAGEITPNINLGFVEDDGTLIQLTGYQVVSNDNALADEDVEYSLNWGSEISPYTLNQINVSLFTSGWDDYISALYDENLRKFIFKGIFPPHILASLQLNSKIVINLRRYLINSMDSNLTTGEVKLDLLNDVMSLPFLPDSGSNGLEYELEFELE